MKYGNHSLLNNYSCSYTTLKCLVLDGLGFLVLCRKGIRTQILHKYSLSEKVNSTVIFNSTMKSKFHCAKDLRQNKFIKKALI